MIEDVSFFMPGGRAGVLLIHGLTGTPSEMHILARGLNRAGFSVYGMQLAGHCGTEKDLIATNWRDWDRSVCEAADFFSRQVDAMFIGGLSMGAVLSLKYAADHPGRVKGVGVYGVTFCYDGWSIPFYARKFGFLSRLLKKLGLFQNRAFIERPPYGVKDERIRKSVEENMRSGDSTKAGLLGNPWPAIAEMVSLNRIVKKLLPRITAPCLIMHAANDDIADIRSNGRLVEKKVAGLTEFVPLANSYHLITIDRDRREVIKRSVEFFSSLCGADMLRPSAEGAEEIIGRQAINAALRAARPLLPLRAAAETAGAGAAAGQRARPKPAPRAKARKK